MFEISNSFTSCKNGDTDHWIVRLERCQYIINQSILKSSYISFFVYLSTWRHHNSIWIWFDQYNLSMIIKSNQFGISKLIPVYMTGKSNNQSGLPSFALPSPRPSWIFSFKIVLGFQFEFVFSSCFVDELVALLTFACIYIVGFFP